MSCNCGTRTYGGAIPPAVVNNCICINDLMIDCDHGPVPCGGTKIIDLKLYNDVSISPCDVEYILLKYDTTAFSSVTLTEDGILSLTTNSIFVAHQMFEIEYKVNSPCSIYSDQATVFVCMKDVCKGKICENACDPCTEECVPFLPEIGVNNNNSNNEITIR